MQLTASFPPRYSCP